MIILDTNVVSAVMKPEAPGQVVAWIDRQESVDLYLTSITVAEILYGIAVLPQGRRRRELESQFADYVEEAFQHRILPFDDVDAREYAGLLALRRSMGRPIGMADGQIAAIARRHRMSVATRNVSDFDQCGIEISDPFAP